MKQPLISIIIVSWNVSALLRECLQSIVATAEHLPIEIIVVDSHSADDTVAMVQREFPDVLLLPQTENVGFPRGNNIGLDHARGDYLLLLNPDATLQEGALRLMIAYIDAHPLVGMVGPQLHNPDGSHQSSRRRFPTFWTGLFESTWWQPYAPAALLAHYYATDSADDAIQQVDWVSGACMLTRRTVLDQVGGMDELYEMYSEELDWCRRIKEVGWQIVYLPMTHVFHHVGKSSEQAVTRRHIQFNRAKLRYFRKYHGEGVYFLLRLAILAGFMQQIGVEGVKWVLGHHRPMREQRIRSYWQVVQSKLPSAGF